MALDGWLHLSEPVSETPTPEAASLLGRPGLLTGPGGGRRARCPSATEAAGARAAPQAGRPTFSGSAETPHPGRGPGRGWTGARVRATLSPLRRRGPFVRSPRAVRPAPCALLRARPGLGSGDQPPTRTRLGPARPARPALAPPLNSSHPPTLPTASRTRPLPGCTPRPAHPFPSSTRTVPYPPPQPGPISSPNPLPPWTVPPSTLTVRPPAAHPWHGGPVPAPAQGCCVSVPSSSPAMLGPLCPLQLPLSPPPTRRLRSRALWRS